MKPTEKKRFCDVFLGIFVRKDDFQTTNRSLLINTARVGD